LYNPLPPGKSSGAPKWQPLQPLRPIELQNAGFVQENFLGKKDKTFALWTVEEQQIASKLAANELDGDAEVTDVAAKEDANSAASDASPSNAPSLSSLDAEAIEKFKQEAYERGLADGQKMQREAENAEAEKAEAASLESLAEKANQLLANIEEGVLALQENPAAYNEPLKRLALHLAEQLTLAELSLSPNSIQSLIDRCIETLDVQTASSVVVELNPNDLSLLQNHKAVPGEQTHTWRMVADTHLLPGSIRVRADDAVVSDLIEHRLETLAHALLEDPKPWQAQTAFQPDRLSARRGKADTVEDALPRDAGARFRQEAVAETIEDVDSAMADLASNSSTQAEPLNLSALDLPDLDLTEVEAKPTSSKDDELGASHD
jgi:flagellar biosynthesis/type III secretory pathway protein FliH